MVFPTGVGTARRWQSTRTRNTAIGFPSWRKLEQSSLWTWRLTSAITHKWIHLIWNHRSFGDWRRWARWVPGTRFWGQNLNVTVSTVHRIYRLFEESGTVDPLSPRKRLDCRRLDLRSELHAVGVILHAEPINVPRGVVFGSYMQVLSIEISPSTVCRTLKRYGLTRKKIHQVPM